jgi:predicted membrane protein
VLGRVTFSVMLLALGGVGIADLYYGTVPPSAYLAAALAVVALGLLVGAVAGRARGLIVWGVLLSLALAASAVADSVDLRQEATGDRTWHPTTAAAVAAQYRHGAGVVTLDLRDVPFTDKTDLSTDIQNGVGEIHVLVPANVDVTTYGAVGVGEVTVLDQHDSGFGRETTAQDLGTDGVGGGTLYISAEIGVGNVEVRREAA